MNKTIDSLVILCLCIVSAGTAYCNTKEYHFKLDAPRVEVVQSETIVRVASCSHYGRTGEPVLPRKLIRLALPAMSKIKDYTLVATRYFDRGIEYPVHYQREPVKLLPETSAPTTRRNGAVYASDSYYPDADLQFLGCQYKHGVKIAVFQVCPVRYNPVRRTLKYFTEFTLEISLATTVKPMPHVLSGALTKCDIRELDRITDNSDELRELVSARARVSSKASSDNYNYVIIAPAVFTNNVSPQYDLWDLAAHRNQRGYSVKLVTVEHIDANYSGARPDGGTDLHTKIRNFISFAYTNWGTRYVLLAGDADTGNPSQNYIPVRGMKMNMDDETNMIADMYYGCLDGTYDNNANGWYGEVSDGVGGGIPDIFAEVHVGRIPVDSYAEIHNVVGKIIEYENTAPNEPYAKRAAMIGEFLGDNFAPPDGGTMMDEIADGSTSFGYTTASFPDDWSIYRLYDKNGEWPASELSALINTGQYQLFSHLGHCNTTYAMKLFNSGVDALVNQKSIFVYSQGCYPGSFDNRSTSAGEFGADDCAGEHFVLGAEGAFAVVFNSRYGYGSGSYFQEGPSQVYNREFFDALWGEDIYLLGEMLDDAKADKVDYFSNEEIGRWCCYQQNLIGDPATRVADFISESGYIRLQPRIVPTGVFLNVTVKDADLTNETEQAVSLATTSGDAETIHLFPTYEDSPVFTQSVFVVYGVSATADNGLLEAVHDTIITGRYIDAHTKEGNVATNHSSTLVDIRAPVILDVGIADVEDTQATVQWYTDEATTGSVTYWTGEATNSVGSTSMQTNHTVALTELTPGSCYFFVVNAVDIAGNASATGEFSFCTRRRWYALQTDVESADGWVGSGLWHRTSMRSHSPSNSWWCGLESTTNYDTGERVNASLTSPSFTVAANAVLSWWEWRESDGHFDHAYVEISPDDGATWWTLHDAVEFSSAWTEQKASLAEFAGETARVRFRFDTSAGEWSNSWNFLEGWYVDDIGVYVVGDYAGELVLGPTHVDSIWTPGNTGTIAVTVFNATSATQSAASVGIVSATPLLAVVSNQAGFAPFAPGEESENQTPLVIAVAPECPATTSLAYHVILEADDGRCWTNARTLSLSAPVSLPLNETFEANIWPTNWHRKCEAPGNIAVTNYPEAMFGSRQLVMHNSEWNIERPLNQVEFLIDTRGASNYVLSFAARRYMYEQADEPPDGFVGEVDADALAVSADGERWRTLMPLTEVGGVGETPSFHSFSLDDVLSLVGYPAHGRVFFRWQQTDFYPAPYCGIALDNISIGPRETNAPAILNVAAYEVEPVYAKIRWNTDVPANGTLEYGLSQDNLSGSFYAGAGTSFDSMVYVLDNTTYYYRIIATSATGLTATDDNVGVMYTFSTPVLTESLSDGYVNPGAQLLSTNVMSWEGIDYELYARCDGSNLYVATQDANVEGAWLDTFIMVSTATNNHRGAPWAKEGEVVAWDYFLGNEADNGWAGWFDESESQMGSAFQKNNPTKGGWYLEGQFSLWDVYGAGVYTTHLAAVQYYTWDNGYLYPWTQVPPSVNFDDNLDVEEMYPFVVAVMTNAAPPVFTNYVSSLTETQAGIRMDADQVVIGRIEYGLVSNELTLAATASSRGKSITLTLDAEPDSTYCYRAIAWPPFSPGKVVTNDNNGALYEFTTLPEPACLLAGALALLLLTRRR